MERITNPVSGNVLKTCEDGIAAWCWMQQYHDDLMESGIETIIEETPDYMYVYRVWYSPVTDSPVMLPLAEWIPTR